MKKPRFTYCKRCTVELSEERIADGHRICEKCASAIVEATDPMELIAMLDNKDWQR